MKHDDQEALVYEIDGYLFRKSSFSRMAKSIFCVGVAVDDDKVLVTNTQSGESIVEFSFDEWDAFLNGVKAGEFDLSELRKQ